MAPGKQSPSSVTCTLQDSPGGTSRNIHGFLLNGISAEDIQEMDETTALGDSARSRVPVGITDSPNLTLSGYFDTTATTGSHAMFQIAAADKLPASVGRELVLVFGDSKTWTRKYHLTRYKAIASTDNIQRFESELVATGAAVWS